MVDAKTGAVAQLYEDYPYPAHGVVSSLVARLAHGAIAAARARVRTRRVRLLDAGCGTGEQTIGLARRNPDIEVVGIDLSPASLAFARQLAAEHRVDVRFEWRDLNEPIDALGRFDVIVSVGTLHHLPEPARGFRNLRGVAEPEATLFGMVYGTFGRWHTFRVRDALTMLCGPDAGREQRLALLAASRFSNASGLLSYLQMLRDRRCFGPDMPWPEVLRRLARGRNTNYLADAFTHPQETSFTWRELANLLTATGWTFVGWPARSGMPDKPEQIAGGAALERLRGLSLLEQASIYERIVCPANLFFLARANDAASASMSP
jgi:SAM-dependent methyltransferase